MAEARPAPARYALNLAYDACIRPANANQQRLIDFCYATWHLRRGSVRIDAGGTTLRATAGDWVYCDPYLMRTQRFSDDAHLVSVRFSVAWRGTFHFQPLAPPHVRREPDPALLDASLALVGVVEGEGGIEGEGEGDGAAPTLLQDCRVQAALHHWLALWHERRETYSPIRPVTHDDPMINRIVAVLSEHRGVGVLDYQRLRRVVGLSRSQIDRLCKARLGMTPRRWCERRSLAQAEQWLREGGLSIKEIAYRLGFVDGSHFARWFRQQTGQAPTAYRATRLA